MSTATASSDSRGWRGQRTPYLKKGTTTTMPSHNSSFEKHQKRCRVLHNSVERYRREEQRLSFQRLLLMLEPNQAVGKCSKTVILDRAISCCWELRRQEALLEDEKRRLTRQNSGLKRRLHELRLKHSSQLCIVNL